MFSVREHKKVIKTSEAKNSYINISCVLRTGTLCNMCLLIYQNGVRFFELYDEDFHLAVIHIILNSYESIFN
jgi:hypothetical protein